MRTVTLKELAGITFMIICFAITVSSPSKYKSDADERELNSSNIVKSAAQVFQNWIVNPTTITNTKESTVEWTDDEILILFSVASADRSLFESSNLKKNETFTYASDEVEVYKYYSSYHHDIKGKIIFQSGSATSL